MRGSVISVVIPDAVQPLGVVKVAPGRRVEVRLRQNVILELSQPRPGYLMEWCRGCGASLTSLAGAPRMARFMHRPGCLARRAWDAGTDG
jgi:hypothetical protein